MCVRPCKGWNNYSILQKSVSGNGRGIWMNTLLVQTDQFILNDSLTTMVVIRRRMSLEDGTDENCSVILSLTTPQ